jgi:hypothetical protein
MARFTASWLLRKSPVLGWYVWTGYPEKAPQLEEMIIGRIRPFFEEAFSFDVTISKCPDEKTLHDVLSRFAVLEEKHIGHDVGHSLTVENEGDGVFYVDWCNGCYQTTGRVFPDHVEDLNAFEDDE